MKIFADDWMRCFSAPDCTFTCPCLTAPIDVWINVDVTTANVYSPVGSRAADLSRPTWKPDCPLIFLISRMTKLKKKTKKHENNWRFLLISVESFVQYILGLVKHTVIHLDWLFFLVRFEPFWSFHLIISFTYGQCELPAVKFLNCFMFQCNIH